MILITGASGSLGGHVLAAVLERHLPVKAMYRSANDAAHPPAGATAVVADFADKASLAAALEGVDRVFLVCSPIPQLVELETSMIDACKAAGVAHIVLNSALGAEDYPLAFPSWHRQVEDHLKASGIGYTILRPNGFMQNILAYLAPTIRSQDAFYDALGDATTTYIDARDIAAVAALALDDPASHAGQTYELNGPEAVTSDQLAQRISRVAGRTIKHVGIPEAAQRESMLAIGMPEWQAQAILDLQRYYIGGQGGEVTETLPCLLEHPPRSLDAFLEEVKSKFDNQPPGA